ncbi:MULTISPECIES: hypothetical protein [Aphanothece]|uniref:hypothetical protein n=1 Tax=Aphanothece TaxID=1121 RepID=UPI00398543F0
MVPARIPISDTLIGSLWREADSLRRRSSQVLGDMGRCQDTQLLARLRRELAELEQRRRELLQAAQGWQRRGVAEPLGLALLVELSRRPLRAA